MSKLPSEKPSQAAQGAGASLDGAGLCGSGREVVDTRVNFLPGGVGLRGSGSEDPIVSAVRCSVILTTGGSIVTEARRLSLRSRGRNLRLIRSSRALRAISVGC